MAGTMEKAIVQIVIFVLVGSIAIVFVRERARLGFGSRGYLLMIFGLALASTTNGMRAAEHVLGLDFGFMTQGSNADLIEAIGVLSVLIGLVRWLPSIIRASDALERNAVALRISDTLSLKTGPTFHAALATELRSALEADSVFIGLVDRTDHRVDAIAVATPDGPGQRFSYDLIGSPCQEALSGKPCVYVDRVAELFPDDVALVAGRVRGYAGAAMVTGDGAAIGLIGALFQGPIPHPELAKTLVGVFAGRAAVEVERERAIQALRERGAELDEAQRVGRMGSWRLGRSADDFLCSPAAFEILGLTPTPSLNAVTLLSVIHPADRPTFLARRLQATAQKAPFQIDLRLKPTSADQRWISFVGRPLAATLSSSVAYGGVIEDITERKQTELELLEAQAGRTQFVAAMSHELRTPLNPILGFSEIMLQPDYNFNKKKKTREYLKMIHESAKHMSVLVDDMLDISRIELNKKKYKYKENDAREIIESVFKKFKQNAEEKDIIIEEKYSADEQKIDADRRSIEQILMNLTSNAIKYTESGGVIELGVIDRGELISLYVRDSGVGMTEDDLDRFLHPFRQGGDPLARSASGLGLGLAISKALAEGMGGSLHVRTELGAGTHAELRLPKKQAAIEGA